MRNSPGQTTPVFLFATDSSFRLFRQRPSHLGLVYSRELKEARPSARHFRALNAVPLLPIPLLLQFIILLFM